MEKVSGQSEFDPPVRSRSGFDREVTRPITRPLKFKTSLYEAGRGGLVFKRKGRVECAFKAGSPERDAKWMKRKSSLCINGEARKLLLTFN